MEQNIGLVVLEHLRYQFHVHVLDVYILRSTELAYQNEKWNDSEDELGGSCS